MIIQETLKDLVFLLLISIFKGGVDDGTLSTFVFFLLAFYDLLGKSVDDIQKLHLILAVFCEVEKPVGPEPDTRVT